MATPYLGEIRPFPYTFAPQGWAMCRGQLMPISQNTALFSLIGTYYGGDGRTTYALPDLQGRVPIHQGAAPGLSDYGVGESTGSAAVDLIQQQLASHTHNLAAFAGRGPKAGESPAGTVLTSSGEALVYDSAVPPNPAVMSPTAVQPTGGGQAHNNLMPYLAINFCIALQGVFPART